MADEYQFTARPAPSGLNARLRKQWDEGEQKRVETNIRNAERLHGIKREEGEASERKAERDYSRALMSGAETATATIGGYALGKKLASGVEKRYNKRLENIKGDVAALAEDARQALKGSGERNQVLLKGIAKNAPGKGPLGKGIAAALIGDIAYTQFRSRKARDAGHDVEADVLDTVSGGSAVAATTLLGKRLTDNASNPTAISARDMAALDAAKIAARGPAGPEPEALKAALPAPTQHTADLSFKTKSQLREFAEFQGIRIKSADTKAVIAQRIADHAAGKPVPMGAPNAGRALRSTLVEAAEAAPVTADLKALPAPEAPKAEAAAAKAAGPSKAELQAAAKAAFKDHPDPEKLRKAMGPWLRYDKASLANVMKQNGIAVPGWGLKYAALLTAGSAAATALMGSSDSAEARSLSDRIGDAGRALKANAGGIAESGAYMLPVVGEAMMTRDLVNTVRKSEDAAALFDAARQGDVKGFAQAYDQMATNMAQSVQEGAKAAYQGAKGAAHYVAGARSNRARYAEEARQRHAAGYSAAPSQHHPVSEYITHRGGKVVTAHFSPEVLANRSQHGPRK
jgi:hypothetical protein